MACRPRAFYLFLHLFPGHAWTDIGRGTRRERSGGVSERPSAAELLEQGVGVLDSTHLVELGWSQRGIEALWRDCPVLQLPGFARPLIRVEAYLAFLDGNTYCDRCGDRVRPSRRNRDTGRALR